MIQSCIVKHYIHTHQLLLLQGFQACGSDPWFGTSDNTSTPVRHIYSKIFTLNNLMSQQIITITVEVHLSTLQPDIFQLIIDLPILSNTREEASKIESKRTHYKDLDNIAVQTYSSVKAVPMYSVKRVFEPEVHYIVQLFSNVLSTLFKRHHWHCSCSKRTLKLVCEKNVWILGL